MSTVYCASVLISSVEASIAWNSCSDRSHTLRSWYPRSLGAVKGRLYDAAGSSGRGERSACAARSLTMMSGSRPALVSRTPTLKAQCRTSRDDSTLPATFLRTPTTSQLQPVTTIWVSGTTNSYHRPRLHSHFESSSPCLITH